MFSFLFLLLLSLLVLSGCGGRFIFAGTGLTARQGLERIRGVALIEIVGSGIRSDGTLGPKGFWTYRFREREVTVREDGTVKVRASERTRVPLLGGWMLDSPEALARCRQHGAQARGEVRVVLRGAPARWEVEAVAIDALTGLRR